MKTVVSIVEGHGEEAALPLLLRRLGNWLSPALSLEIAKPIRVNRNRFLNKDDEFRRMLALAAGKCQENGWLLILLDSDKDCPAAFGNQLLGRVIEIIPHKRVSVVLANREFEAWFIAAAESLHEKRGFLYENCQMAEAESIRGAKEWLGARMNGGKYREVTDQPAFSALMDLQQAHKNSRSFRKLCSEWQKNMLLAEQH